MASAPASLHNLTTPQATPHATTTALPRLPATPGIPPSPVPTRPQVAKQSKAAMSLCMWVRAMDTYARVIRIVEPKRSALGSAQGRLSEMEGALAGKQAQLAELEQRVEGLQGQLRGTQEELRSLQFQVCSATQRARRCSAGGGGEAGGRRAGGAPREGRGLESSGRPTYAPAFARSPQPLPSTLPAPSLLLPGHHPCTAGLPNVFPWVPPTPMFRLPAPCPPPPRPPSAPHSSPPSPQAELTRRRLVRAEKLTGALADEAVRWRAQSEAIGSGMQLLVGDVFLAAACISYVGAFSGGCVGGRAAGRTNGRTDGRVCACVDGVRGFCAHIGHVHVWVCACPRE